MPNDNITELEEPEPPKEPPSSPDVWHCPDCGIMWFDGRTGRTSACPHRIEPGDNAEPPLGD